MLLVWSDCVWWWWWWWCFKTPSIRNIVQWRTQNFALGDSDAWKVERGGRGPW